MEYGSLDILYTDIKLKKWRHQLNFTKMSHCILPENVGIIQAASSIQSPHSPGIVLWPNAHVKESELVGKDLFNNVSGFGVL